MYLSLFSTAGRRKALRLKLWFSVLFCFVSSVPVLLKRQLREPWHQISWTCAVMNLHQRPRTVRSWKKVPRHTRTGSTSPTHMWCSFVCLLPQRFSCRQLSLWVIITAVFVREWKKIFHAGTDHSFDNKIAFLKVESKQVEFELGNSDAGKNRRRSLGLGSLCETITTNKQTTITTALSSKYHNIYMNDIFGY